MKHILVVSMAIAAVAAPAKSSGGVPKRSALGSAFMGALAGTAAALPGLKGTQGELVMMLKNREKLEEAFGGFLHEFGAKSYASPVAKPCSSEPCGETKYSVKASEGATEYEQRLNNFEANVRAAVERNSQPGNKAVHGVTKFMDMSQKEFTENFTGLKIDWENDEELRQFRESSTMYNPPSIDVEGKSRDWRDDGVVTPVKDQGHCGSCWAFSTTETMESAALVQGLTDKANPFIGSPQEAVACDHFLSMGCSGGNPLFALQYYRFWGLEPEKAFPYTSGQTGVAGKCSYDKSQGKYHVASTSVVSLMGFGEDNMVKHLLADGPLSIAVYAEPWMTYKSGIMTADQCRGKMDHAVQLVGVNQDDAGNPYWIVRNSWNTNWGEDGYIRLELGKNTCSIAFMSVGATVKKIEDNETMSVDAEQEVQI